MKFKYIVSGKGLNPEDYTAVDWSHTGECSGDHPFHTNGRLQYNEDSQLGFAILNAVGDCSDVLDACQGALYPHLDITNNYDGTIDAVVDTHGFGDIAVKLERIEA